MNKKTLGSYLGLIIVFLMLIPASVVGEDFYTVVSEPHEIYNENNKLLTIMARTINIGDELIASDNKHYRVYKVEGKKAYAKYIGLHDIKPSEQPILMDVFSTADNKNNVIALYHTHSSESYVPSDGTESEPGNGGIFDVGEAFAIALRNNGVHVIHDFSAHEPHDAQAYNRSRRTAVKLLQQAPVAIIDVHRDGIPDPEFYREEINGQVATQIRLVVGRQNQNMQSNLDFAKRLKMASEEIHPGIVREIFMAKGNYNQDLSPRAILIEAGTYTNNKEEAEAGVVLFADVIPTVLGIAPGTAKDQGTQKSDWSSIVWVLLLAIIAGGTYLVISTGSWKNALTKLKHFVTKEWGGSIEKVSDRLETIGNKIESDEPENRKEN